MSASSEYLRVLTDITREGGATRAATARANAQIWGNTVSKLGDFASDAIKQYGIDNKAKKDEQWQQNLSDLFKRTSEEFKAQQEPSMAEMTQAPAPMQTPYQQGDLSSLPLRPSSAPTMPNFQPTDPRLGPAAGAVAAAPPEVQNQVLTGSEQGQSSFTGPELKNARPPRQSPFPTPSEILALGQPLNGIKVIDGLAALQKLNPQDDPETRLKRMQASYVALDQFSDKEKAAALPGLMGAFEQAYGINLGEKEFTPERWAAMGKALQVAGAKPAEDFTLSEGQARFKGAGGEPIATVPKTAPPKTDYTLGSQRFSGETNEPIATGAAPELTPYQKAELAQQEKNFGLAQQRLALAIKTSNRAGIAEASGKMADAIVLHPELFGQLTATAKEKVIPELTARGFTDFKKPPSATMENRLASAKAVVQTGDDIIASTKDPKIMAMLGPLAGRYNSVREFIGNPPPGLEDFAGSISSFALAQMGVHGMRNAEMAKQIESMLDAKFTPEAIASRINGINKFANHLLENEGRAVGAKEGDTKPIPGYPGTEQTYRGGKWIRTK